MRTAMALWLACAAALAGAAEKPPPEEAKAPPRTRLLWPVFGTKTTEDSTSAVYAPFVCYGKGPGESHLAVLPVYVRRERDESTAELFFPAFGRFAGKEVLQPYGGVPLLVKWADTEEVRSLELPVLRVGKGDPRSDAPYSIVDLLNLGSLFKLLEVRKAKDGWSVEFLSLLSGEPAAAAPEPGASVNALNLLGMSVFRVRSEAKRSLVQLVPILAVGRDEEHDRRFFHLWPFFGTSRTGEARAWTIASPLITRRADPDRSSFYIFPILWLGKDAKKDTEHIHLWPLVGWRRQGTERTWTLADPLLAYAHDEGEPRYAAALPVFAFFHRPPEGRRGVYAFPVVSVRKGKKGEEARDFAVVPLFWLHRDDKDKAQATQVLPFLYARNEAQESHTYGLLPLVWLTRAPQRWRFDLVPIFSTGRSPEASHVSLWPLVGWGRQRDKKRFWALLGLVNFGW